MTVPDIYTIAAKGGSAPQHMRFVSPEFVFIGRDNVPVPAPTNAIRFNSIQAAIDSIAEETGGAALEADGYTVVVYPGVYNESIVMQSNVAVIGTSETTVFINGAISFPAGSGVNLLSAGVMEQVLLRNIRHTGALSYTVDAAKPNNVLSRMRLVRYETSSSAWTLAARSTAGVNGDFIGVFDCNISGNSVVSTNMAVYEQNSQHLCTTATFNSTRTNGAGVLRVLGGLFSATGTITTNYNDSSVQNAKTSGEFVVNTTGQLSVSNAATDTSTGPTASRITCNNGGKAFIKNSVYRSANMSATGAGSGIDRDVYAFTWPLPTGGGPITLNPPYVNPTRILPQVTLVAATPVAFAVDPSLVTAANVLTITTAGPDSSLMSILLKLE